MSSDQASVFLLCENRLLREALIRILAKRANVVVVGACGYSPEALPQVIACQPQVVLLDSFGVGFAQPHLLHQIRESLASTGTIMVGMEPKEENFLLAVREGTGRCIWQWRTGSMTRRSPSLEREELTGWVGSTPRMQRNGG